MEGLWWYLDGCLRLGLPLRLGSWRQLLLRVLQLLLRDLILKLQSVFLLLLSLPLLGSALLRSVPEERVLLTVVRTRRIGYLPATQGAWAA